MINEKDPKHQQTKKKLKTIGKICLIAGICCIIYGIITFPEGFMLFFVGMPLTFVGSSMTMFAFQGEVARYSANEVTPVAKDVVNYMVDGTQDSIKTVARSISEGINGSNPKNMIKCRHCNAENDDDAKFCDTCGKPIVNHKVCSQCQAKNELEATYCNKCGTRFYN
ncbi:MAG: putative rane protein [Haloplasmataceae bacterium]|nr:putative rane protein [Haloplasmataceae bacterium]